VGDRIVAETSIRRAAIDVIQIAQDLIDAHHEHLLEAHILWLTTTSKRASGGHVVLGTSSRSNPLQRFLSSIGHVSSMPSDYIVLIDEKRWARALLTQRKALVDHLLCRMIRREHVNKRSGETTYSWATVGPDVSEFSDVIRRHGIWLPEQQLFAKAVRETGRTMQIKFPDLSADDDDEVEAKPHDRTTTVDANGTVVETEHVAEASATGGVEGQNQVAGEDQPDSDAYPEPAESSTSNGNGHVPDEIDEAIPDWKSQSGITRKRGTRSSEQAQTPEQVVP